jgi:hypothetical protein
MADRLRIACGSLDMETILKLNFDTNGERIPIASRHAHPYRSDSRMPTPGREQVRTGRRLSARLAEARGLAPAAAQFVVYRATSNPATPIQEGYLVPGETHRLSATDFDFWLAERGLDGTKRSSVAVLVIREHLTANGMIRDCEVEFRLGAVDGPYDGNPARIVFAGPARRARFYWATPEGGLAEVAATPGATIRPGSEIDAAAMHDAVQASCGTTARILDTREPTSIEAMVGITSVLHVMQQDGREVACGILRHGPNAIALWADFPRFDVKPTLSAHQSGLLDALAAAEGLIACETRRDEHGLAIVARRSATADLVLVRFDGETAGLAPYVPGRPSGLATDQERWLHYIATYEALDLLDAYRDGTSDALIVLTGGADGAAWRHHVDIDGIEKWRRADTGSVAATLHGRPRRDGAAPAEPLAEAHPAAGPGLAPAALGSRVPERFPSSACRVDEVGDRRSTDGCQTSGYIH